MSSNTEEPSVFLLELLQAHHISGCLILLRESADKDVTISIAADNIHETSIIRSLASIILEKESGQKGDLSQIIQNAAHTMICVCDIIADLSSVEE